ncbi:hypothetical protein PHYBLDRAFT_66899 [Phycomyces blakesleeanus NRRL 1555(-)]|uniref:Uncharacterized protein n=1 Tax=Phycomyces blakesleeanus (strain ATCC 8743b / DSM 1359 / FGSC 10004 / NBRC 33097 / NRRL 1555) TaxID=763407 RepID=A0A162ZUN5_PHYB8|nr:hypothetical protein PHYBLDRAFT_66899 [Phycomyces blakesleeanus NRRL 1555(-)]OAD69131.1 hypothetical protein PHYBLDRAFT_66899 [Phycomyces blakesleeanus NRRL 1555(-)]|eukprot:XP_018287171.1 hypothetical protein PHYBLDRAFT_66899 [Phycomyces blakesleeanus NRRL 1555(-)]
MNTPQRSLDYSSDKETLKTPVNQRFRQITTSPAPSPIRRYLSSTLNDFREKGNKELGRIYETFSELTGISPIPKERSQKTLKTITKRTSKSTLDADQILNEHKNHTFLTPIMERHSVRDSIKQDIGA